MRNSKQETIADIVAALRAVAYIQTAESPSDVLEFANRIEAAAKREREAGAEAAQVCGEIGEMIGREATREKSSRVGNAAKMRKELEEIVDMVTYYFPDFTIPRDDDELRDSIIDKAIDYTSLRDDFIKAVIIARDAISAPPRNCDVGTVEEQAERFRRFCETHKPYESQFTEEGELLCPSTGCELIACNYGQCALAWSQMPYEEGGTK